MQTLITKDELRNEQNCARLVAKKILQYYDYKDIDKIESLLHGFGKGLNNESMCGAMTGAIFAINSILTERELGEDLIDNVIGSLKQTFKEKYSSINCNIILQRLVGIEKITSENEDEHLKKCSSLMSNTTNEVSELINLTISLSNPIMKRFNNI